MSTTNGRRVMTDMNFARGMVIGLPVSILLWALIALAILAASGCQSYQPMGEEIWRAV